MCKRQVIPDVVRDIATSNEGRLGNVHHKIQRSLKAVGYTRHQKLDVTVQQGDRAVPHQIVSWLSRLVEEGNEARKKVLKRSRSVATECCITDLKKHRQKRSTKRVIKLIG